MVLPPPKQQMSPQEFKALRDFIYSKCGIYFNEAKQYFLENRLSRRITELGIASFGAYLDRLQGPTGREEMTQLFNEITTNETSFWRNPPQIEAFQRIVLPDAIKLARERGSNRFRIWSAACSSGEEPYTLAMVCNEVRETLLKGMAFEIVATDISERVLVQAREGSYGSYTLRNLTPEQIKLHFQEVGPDAFEVKPDLKASVFFKHMNLVEYASYRNLGVFDVVFCRNVLIYFDDAVKREVLKGFHSVLHPKAYLLVGHSESIHAFSTGFELMHFAKAMGYRRRD